ncbi:MAG: HNH endonuclease [Armatimonas sp.]
MSISATDRTFVRQRARYACEYCGVTEVETGAELTIDHYHPTDEGGSDVLDNLVYACHRRNEHKAAYWPKSPNDLPLWNPRQDIREEHFIPLMDGTLAALTPVGIWTIQRLRLNRLPLVQNRLLRQTRVDRDRLLRQYQDTVRLLAELMAQQESLLQEQLELLEEYRRILNVLDRQD